VSDFKPVYHSYKVKKKETLNLSLEKTPDILAILGKEKTHQFLVGFAAETQNLLAEAVKKLKAKNSDIIVANDVSQPDAGFKVTTNKVCVIYKDGVREQWPLMSKEGVASRLWDRIRTFL
jgi:phosphopantothenoylcysteine decarboxylase/phosphopantothenate--cysteine ligase